jgi:O-succinylbenzoic acid--CoA ligase
MSNEPGDRATPLLLPQAARLRAAERGESPAVIEASRTWSWGELEQSAGAVVEGLAQAGLVTGTRVGLLAPTSAAALAFLHGAVRAGFVVVPLNLRWTNSEVDAFLAEVEATIVVTSAELAARIRALGRRVIALEALVDGPAASARDNLGPLPTDPAMIVATSGTTGAPKGALLTHSQLTASAVAWNEFLPPATGWLASLSLAHVGGLGVIWRAALAGVPVVVPVAGDQASLWASIAEPVSHVSVVPHQLARLLESVADPVPAHLRAVLLGGGPIPEDLVKRALGMGWPVVPTYGMTESASGVTALATAGAAERPGSAGRPLPGAEIRITRPGVDGVGDIEVRGPSIFAGYVGRPEETAAAFDRNGWYRTGDLGRLDQDGYLTVADRRLDLIVSGGENVYPAEIEAVLASHPAIADAGVAGRPDPSWGAVPVAAISLRAGAAAADTEILDHCRDRLAGFKIPVTLVRVDAIPRLASGKLDRGRLRALLSISRISSGGSAEAPGPGAHSMPSLLRLNRPDGVELAYRRLSRSPDAASAETRAILMLHSTLSSGWQLKGLARLASQWAVVILPDRRGSGVSLLAEPRPVALTEQIQDAIAVLDAAGLVRVTVFGHSYGAVVALGLASAHPERVDTVVVYEPPLMSLLPSGHWGGHANLPARIVAAHAAGGKAAATRVFLEAIGAGETLAKASASTRAALLDAGDGVLADVGAMDEAVVDLGLIRCPVVLVTGDASEPFYAPIADAAAASIPQARRVRLPGMTHDAPITRPAALAELIHDALAGRSGPGPVTVSG